VQKIRNGDIRGAKKELTTSMVSYSQIPMLLFTVFILHDEDLNNYHKVSAGQADYYLGN
jgi:hypothetical protein